MTSKVKKKKYLGFSHFFYEKWAGHVSEQVSEQVSGQDFMQNWNFFGLRGDFPYCKRFVLAGTKREPSKQSLWEKVCVGKIGFGGINKIKKPGKSCEQVSRHTFQCNWSILGLCGDFTYCKRFVLAGTKREPSKQSLWGKL